MAKRLQLLSPLKGEPGDPGIYVGNTEPTDDSVRVWIDPDDNASPDVVAGSDGGYYTPTVTQSESGKATFAWTPSQSDMPTISSKTISLPAGPQGEKGDPGDPGDPGTPGKSAYQYAQDGGYTGTEEEFALKLASESAGGASGGDKWELIANHSVEEVVDSVSFSTDMNGDPFSLTKMKVFMTLPKYDYEGATDVGYATLRINGAGDYIYPTGGWQSVDLIGDIEALGDICLVEWKKIPTDKHGGAANAWGIFGGVKFVGTAGTFDDIHSFEWGLFNRKVLPGAIFKIYGVRA